jgi:glycosyltransferase involved in cell wall biosynthesis
MRILLLSAFDAQSHRYWHQGLTAALPQHDWTTVTLPARHFAWRFRGNALSFLSQHAEALNQAYDLLLVTSMVDLVTLRGLLPQFATVPAVVYFHENQFAYPQNSSQHSTLELQLTSLYTALSGQSLLFNSDYNRQTFLKGVQVLLQKLPERFPASLNAQLHERSRVLSVPLMAPSATVSSANKRNKQLQIVWNHRWEYDKGPDRLLALVDKLLHTSLDFRLHIVGQQFRKRPAEFEQAAQLLSGADRLGQFGFVTKAAHYRDLLVSADIVLSTAIHDFQGLSVLEAVAKGCTPCVPDRLAYPEWFPQAYRYASSPDDVDAEATAAVMLLNRLSCLEREEAAALAEPFLWHSLGDDYAAALESASRQPVGASWAE